MALPRTIEFYLYKEILPGYAWIFPMGDGRAYVGLGMRLDKFRRHKGDLKGLLNHFLRLPDIEKRLKPGYALTGVKTWQLSFGSQSMQRAYSGALLVGDAARVLHPLAGLGANVGFEDVRDLLARISALPTGTDPGMTGIWRAFARKRRVRAQLMVAAMAGFRQVYAEGAPLRGWLRNSAISWVNQARPLKQQIIREALGLGPLAESL